MVNGNELMTKIYMVPIIITNVKIMYHAVLPAAIVSCFTTFFHRRTINFNELKIIVWGGGQMLSVPLLRFFCYTLHCTYTRTDTGNLGRGFYTAR